MVDTLKIILVGDRVLIKPENNLSKTTSGLYLPPGVSEKEKVQGGYVLKVGPGYLAGLNSEEESWKSSGTSKYIPLQAHENDFALFLRKDAVEIELEGEKLVIVPHSAILMLHRDEDLVNV